MRRTLVVFAAITAAGLALVACGSSGSPSASGGGTTTSTPSGSSNSKAPEVSPQGDISDSAVYVAQSDPAGKYTIKVPEGWARMTSSGGVSFTDKLNTIRVETLPAATAPTVATASANERPRIAQSAAGYQAGKVSLVSRTSGSAVLITYQATGTPNAVTGKTIQLAFERYEFWAKGTEAIVTLSGPVGADNVDPWKLVTESFTWR